MPELRLVVTSSEAATPQIRTIVLAPEGGGALPSYRAGAHIKVQLPEGGERPYSLVNTDPSPDATQDPQTYRLGVRLEEDSAGGSRFMHGLEEGDVLTAVGPENQFAVTEDDAPIVLIAGGIGITPILSMASELTAQGRPFDFHYCGRTRSALAFVDPLTAVCGDALNLHYDDEPDTAIDLDAIVAAARSGAHLFVCGPRGMIETVRERAHDAGIDKDHVHFELFSKHDEQVAGGSFEVEISSTGEVFTIPPDRSIIEVLEEAGIDLIYDCQRGDCGICQTGVIDGVPDHRDVILTDDERAANDVMQICVSRAKSERLVLDL
ncbi:PDR/VanB family oxidoreductase [Nitratireductor sp. XY-223]|uniref:PDR/VanB family oxidoreductase n=1 Tax=Nitratireductor sp. XY-223 TaxID=2561926 RepID=UPI0010AB4164|nr:PDR/VanB family oxidoreductase [Nitratireductor sp. XY-223]